MRNIIFIDLAATLGVENGNANVIIFQRNKSFCDKVSFITFIM